MVPWNWPETPVAIVVTLVMAVVARWLLVRAIRRGSSIAVERAKQRRSQQGDRDAATFAARHAARAATMGSLLRSVTNIVITVLAVLTTLAILGIPLTPLLASAGVGGVALGIGAQSLVRDYLSGIFMIVEDQYGVGDLVDLGEAIGTVEDVGLRVTRLRDSTGQVWYIRNGEIARVGNQTQGWSTATVDVPVDPAEDPATVIDLLKGVAQMVHDEPRWSKVLLEVPRVVGVQSVEAGRMTIRIVAKTQTDTQSGVQRALLDAALQAFKRSGVRGPKVLPAPPTL